MAGVGREDDAVLGGRGMKEVENASSAAVGTVRCDGRGRVGRMRVAQNISKQELHVTLNLRLAVDATTGVVEVYVTLLVEPRELRCT